MKRSFSISEALGFGWNTLRANYKFWIIATLLTMSVGGFGSGLGGSLGDNSEKRSSEVQESNYNQEKKLSEVDHAYPSQQRASEGRVSNVESNIGQDILVFGILALLAFPFGLAIIVLVVLTVIVQNCFWLGHVKLCLDAVRGLGLKYETLLSMVDIKKSLRFIGAEILYVLLIVFGLLLFILPGVYFGIKYSFVHFGIVDKGYGVFESLRYSSKLTKGVKLKLFAYFFITFLLFIFGLMLFLVGAVFIGIIESIAFAYVYDLLRKQLEAENENPAVVVES